MATAGSKWHRLSMGGILFFPLLLSTCASEPAIHDPSVKSSPELNREIEGLGSEDSRRRHSAEKQIRAMGPKVCRALGREVTARVEAADTGPGFVCLVRMLGALGGRDACRPLSRTALKRALDPAVRVEAVRALGVLGVHDATEALLECTWPEEPLPLRLAALGALAPFTDGNGVREALKKHLTFGSPPVRESAARSLLSCEVPDLLHPFKVRLMDTSPGVRLLAVSYFLRFPDPSAALLLQSLASSDRDVRVVIAAGKALKALEGK